METIGIVGCGLLGSALAERYQAAGFDVSGYDIDGPTLERFPARRAASLNDVAGCRYIVLCLPDSGVSAQVLNELVITAGVTVIDSTTGDPDEMAGLAQTLAARGVPYLDATIGGSSRQVRMGEAIAIVGGEKQAFSTCRHLFDAFAARTFYVGEAGSGARMKLAMNLVLGLNRAALAEGLTFAKVMGLDPALTLEVLKAGPAYSQAMDAKGEKMLSGVFIAEARLSQHLKDVRLILKQASQKGKALPLSQTHRQLLEIAEACGFGLADNSAVIKAYDD